MMHEQSDLEIFHINSYGGIGEQAVSGRFALFLVHSRFAEVNLDNGALEGARNPGAIRNEFFVNPAPSHEES